MTDSVDFRASSRSNLCGYWSEDLLLEISDDVRYTDPNLPVQDNPGEISAEALDRLHAMIMEKMGDREAFGQWFGRYSSTPKYPDIDWSPEEPVEVEQMGEMLANGAVLRRNPASRFSFVEQERTTILFVDGQSLDRKSVV